VTFRLGSCPSRARKRRLRIILRYTRRFEAVAFAKGKRARREYGDASFHVRRVADDVLL
jgi:hypothetical protein